MKVEPLLDDAVDTSHGRVVRVDVLDPSGAVVDELPVADRGEVTGTARSADRWSGRVTVPLDDRGRVWLPRSPADPLSGFSGYSVRVYAGAIVDRSPVLGGFVRYGPSESAPSDQVAKLQRSVDHLDAGIDPEGSSVENEVVGRGIGGLLPEVA